jgi:glucosamine--fructose-6-phosphate aminotransferase (isomerizing)
MALLDAEQHLHRVRSIGKISQLQDKIDRLSSPFNGSIGIAHTRWATHGVPSEQNAHPHISRDHVAVVHNGIIENYETLKATLIDAGYEFSSQTDTEVVAHTIHAQLQKTDDFLDAVIHSLKTFEGAYAFGVMSRDEPDTLIAARKGSPLVIGIGIGEHFIASDVSALLPVTQSFIFLEDGDVARLKRDAVEIFNIETGERVERPVRQSSLNVTAVELGEHRHYMHKEIFEQPQAVIDTLEGRITQDQVLVSSFGPMAESIFASINRIHIIACGTSYHAGMVARYWAEDIIGVPCQVEVASEFRYRNPIIENHTLFITISQSGETADTLAALQQIKALRENQALVLRRRSSDANAESDQETVNYSAALNIPTLSICNVPESSLTREADLTFLTHAGPEIGVASTKAFTTQLVALALLITGIGKVQNRLDDGREALIAGGLHKLPNLIKKALGHEEEIRQISESFADKQHALFLGRGTMYPIALEGALKLKEISYIHAEAYPAGELKHGPLALIDENMPVIAIAPLDDLLEKLKSNIQEVKARGGQMIVFEDEQSDISSETSFKVVKATTNVGRITAPITYNILLQLLSYHVALIKGTDVDQPRNLAKSVTVE